MTSFISIIFILSSYVLIFNIPTSHEYNNQGYHLSTISQVLTPSERFTYVLFGTLPSRIYYSYEKRCYVVRGQAGYYKNDLRRKKGKRYKVVPRWQYYMSKLSPMSLIKSGFEFLSVGKALLFGGGFSDGDEEEDPEKGDADPDADGGADGGADDDADGGADDGKNNDKEPGLLSKGMDMGKSMLSPLLNLFGGSKDTNNEKKDDSNDKKDDNNDKKDDNNEKKDDNNDKKDEKEDNNKDDKEGDKPTDYTGMVTDVLTSDSTKDAIKTGISLFVPGGPAIVTAIDAAEKYKSAGDKIDKVEDKIPKLK
ncbi:putative surface protein SACOL0050 [Metopolophium dirhodum]|uniref:putative surface protein SACOL0050 n=1 Tax=Metopolophium dirhodum TaxID=44670 RepID=UPI00298F595F|nr:putative surface protein SACOL0050 [Metopolophium dirhodum]